MRGGLIHLQDTAPKRGTGTVVLTGSAKCSHQLAVCFPPQRRYKHRYKYCSYYTGGGMAVSVPNRSMLGPLSPSILRIALRDGHCHRHLFRYKTLRGRKLVSGQAGMPAQVALVSQPPLGTAVAGSAVKLQCTAEPPGGLVQTDGRSAHPAPSS